MKGNNAQREFRKVSLPYLQPSPRPQTCPLGSAQATTGALLSSRSNLHCL